MQTLVTMETSCIQTNLKFDLIYHGDLELEVEVYKKTYLMFGVVLVC